MTFQVSNPQFAEEIRASFAKQSIMTLIGAELALVEPGIVEVNVPYRNDLAQQHGYLHAGIVTTIADSAAGYAAYTLMPARSEVLRMTPWCARAKAASRWRADAHSIRKRSGK